MRQGSIHHPLGRPVAPASSMAIFLAALLLTIALAVALSLVAPWR